ncbi:MULTISPECIES: hypothetical protein [Roseobacteraceae]|uniref:Uncharacterized protein n=1 Tax=Pseudosulfitobacter pseudonitzschiae TaxID=1402135 RepID=A0A221K7S5_9RHOB|nr:MULTISPECIES: hypothetical protein [Roseobacteraceae]ASM75029.1 hypothetical protein SULPSESMR1_04303 [Pseudosulfitobacter pseudonitzschiae]
MTFKRTIHAVDSHAGTPKRVVTGAVNDNEQHKLPLREPRGYPTQCSSVIATPTRFDPVP